MITASRSSLKLLSIGIGLLFTVAVYYTMHYNPRWDWTAPGVGKLPQQIVRDFMDETYARGQGAAAHGSYFAKDAVDNVAAPQDRAPVAHEVREIIAQGMTVAVVHRMMPVHGEPAVDAIDVFQIKDGRIIRRDRYLTTFAQ
ncbi:hypothetical protein [Sphingosinicella sp.]|uniref:hypothetical protein n=1 Tax=Sphingosinicella sp. TaxID=1917971 RepID=UPI0035AFDB01